MNGIDKITERIAADNQSEVSALQSRSEARAKEIFAGYQALADQDYQDALKQGRADAEAYVERQSRVSRLEGKKLLLGAKQEMLDRAYQLAMKKLLSLPEADYAELLIRLAVAASETGHEALIFSTTDRARYGKRVVIAANELLSTQGREGGLTLSEESRDFQGGLYVSRGSAETNCTFDALLRQHHDTSAKEVAQLLFD